MYLCYDSEAITILPEQWSAYTKRCSLWINTSFVRLDSYFVGECVNECFSERRIISSINMLKTKNKSSLGVIVWGWTLIAPRDKSSERTKAAEQTGSMCLLGNFASILHLISCIDSSVWALNDMKSCSRGISAHNEVEQHLLCTLLLTEM